MKVEWRVLIWVFWHHRSGGCQESEGVTTALGKTSRVEDSDLCCSKSSRYQHSPNSYSERHTGKIRNRREIFIHVEPQRQGLDLLVEPYCPPPAHRTRCSLARSSDLASALPSTSAADRWRGPKRALWCRGKDENYLSTPPGKGFLCGLERLCCVRRSSKPVPPDLQRRRGVFQAFRHSSPDWQWRRVVGACLGERTPYWPPKCWRGMTMKKTVSSRVVKEANNLGRWTLG